MKKILLFSIMIILLYACASKKKMTRTLDTTKGWIDYAMTDERKEGSRIDTSKLSEYDISITRIEYFPPSIDYHVGSDSLASHGAIKSIEKIDLHKKDDQKGITENENEGKSSTGLKGEMEAMTDETTKEKPVVNLKYVFYILVLVVAVFLYLKRKTIFQKLKSLIVSILKMVR
ncbi:MAG: hypothetical protein AB2L20_12040 [Mangrovibacterium sp.]